MLKNTLKFFKKVPVVIAGLSLLTTLGFSSITTASSTTTGGSSGACPSKGTLNLTQIITKGNAEIERRLTTLNKLDSLITASVKISSSDKTALTNEVNNEISGLNTDKTTLDAATTICAAREAAQSIFSEYRVYALVVPQVFLIKAADRQQTIEAQLNTIYTGLVSAISSPTSTQTSELEQLNTEITDATSLSQTAEKDIIALNPSDYNTDHTLLLQYYTQLNQAKSDIGQAITLAKELVASVK